MSIDGALGVKIARTGIEPDPLSDGERWCPPPCELKDVCDWARGPNELGAIAPPVRRAEPGRDGVGDEEVLRFRGGDRGGDAPRDWV